jgi:hypothetical protein
MVTRPTTRTQRATLAIAAALVTTIAGWLHAGGMHGVIAWDEANYTAAAQLGIVANAFDSSAIGDLRHEHAPLMCYAIAVSTAVFGGEEWAVRLPAVALSALVCGLLVLVAFDLARDRSFAWRLACASAAGMLMATSPASIEMAGVIQPHSFVIFFLVLNIWTLARYLRDLKRRDAIAFGLSLAGQFIAMEYGPIVLGFAFIAVALSRPHLIWVDAKLDQASLPRRCGTRLMRLPRMIHADIWLAAAACLLTIAVTWPAGLFKLGIARNFAYYLLYASHGHPVIFRGEMHTHVPKYAYAYWYWLDYPLLLVGMIAGLVLVAAWAACDRGAVAVTVSVFTFGLALSVHASHIMQLCKSIFMIPPLALGGPLAAAWLLRGRAWRAGRVFAARAAGAALVLLGLAAIPGGRLTPMSRDADPNQRLIALCRTIAQQAPLNDRILAQGWPIVRYLLHTKFNRPDIQVFRYDPRNLASDRLGQRLAASEFTWAVTIGPTTAAYRDCPVLTELHERWRVVEDASLPGREYRVYRRAAVPVIATTAEAQGAGGIEGEGETP